MIIKKKLDIHMFLEIFETIASYDEFNQKYYFVFYDKERGGQYTLMKTEDQWSVHGKGDDYCDLDETFFEHMDDCITFIWKNRGSINQELREQVVVLV